MYRRRQPALWMPASMAVLAFVAFSAIGTRLPGTTDADIEAAIDRAEILRIHILRPTWHFVPAADIRWMLQLSGPHIQRTLATYYRQTGFDDALRLQCNRLIAKMLEGKQLTRPEIMAELGKVGIPTQELLSAHIMYNAELEGIVCNGSRRGKEHTYALLNERVPPGKTLSKEEALGELARRYFSSHGPAALKDYVWWSGLPAAEARAGLEMTKSQFICEKVNGKEYWFAESAAAAVLPPGHLVFLPAFDEFLVAYTDRSASLDPALSKTAITGNGIFKPVIVAGGRVTGIWKRTVKNDRVLIEASYFNPAEALEKSLVETAARPFADFLGLKMEIRNGEWRNEE